MALRLIKFLTDSDGPTRAVNINPDYVATVEADMKAADSICHITLCSGHYYRVLESEVSASKRLQYGS
ncbi:MULTISPECIES: hypothetical protein [unclassified Spirosoma]|uniref:hypothetical protein n=1 Tax=unclassified Spirosoma TaxID=2621999 RepID=UPI0009698720|nr:MULTISPECIES: hypothetical protein [unclassified Spirosoma]MBN8820773.1 hypothetical protein [Spirosoma sp.]OJW76365.1 MAG: hypothetical protein BGO59_22865 [Spirosoma sp. 48-14]